RNARLLDDARLDELRARPEAAIGDVDVLSAYAQDRGWPTDSPAGEVRAGRGDRLAVGGYRLADLVADGPAGTTYKATHPAPQGPVSVRLLTPHWTGTTAHTTHVA